MTQTLPRSVQPAGVLSLKGLGSGDSVLLTEPSGPDLAERLPRRQWRCGHGTDSCHLLLDCSVDVKGHGVHMCVCVCMPVDVCTSVSVYVCACQYTCACMPACVCTCVCACQYAVPVCMPVHVCPCVHACQHVCARVYAHASMLCPCVHASACVYPCACQYTCAHVCTCSRVAGDIAP